MRNMTEHESLPAPLPFLLIKEDVMGTRSQTSIIVNGESVGMVYKHYDGVPENILPILMAAASSGDVTPESLKEAFDDEEQRLHEQESMAIEGIGRFESDVCIQDFVPTDLDYFYELDVTERRVRAKGGKLGANASSDLLVEISGL